ncbi:MAG: cyclic nucleotide-binding domain-containing protein [Flexilinea sp.]|nr:cyclic nucleotide-binding domain-containing protein [Flexilinea sp.]
MKNITNDLILKKYASKDVFIRYFRGYSKDVFKIFEFQSGEYIVRQEEPLTYLHLLMEGRCNVHAILPNGKKAILRKLTAKASDMLPGAR